jgi:hypothetical protein
MFPSTHQKEMREKEMKRLSFEEIKKYDKPPTPDASRLSLAQGGLSFTAFSKPF